MKLVTATSIIIYKISLNIHLKKNLDNCFLAHSVKIIVKNL